MGIGIRFVRPHQQPGYLLSFLQIHRLAGRRRVRTAGLAKGPAQERAGYGMGARSPTMRAGCAVRPDINVNKAWIDPAASIPADRQPLPDASAKVVRQYVRPANQL